MKKILFYIGSMQYGGANRVIANLIDFLMKKSYSIVLINDIVSSKMKKEYNVDKRVNRYYLEQGKMNKYLKNFIKLKKIRTIVKQENPNIIVSFMGPPNIRMIFATIGLKNKKIVSVRNDPYKEYGKGIKKIIARIILNKADGCVFQTNDAKKFFNKKLQNKSRIIFNPVNPVFYDIKRSSDTKNIITIGRLEKQKNHKLLIDAYVKIWDKIKDNKLIIYGEGSLREELEKYIKELNMTDNILLPGNIDNVWEALAKAKLFVLSSNFEGMPNVLMEAMATGTPVISTNCPCGGPKDLILNGLQGKLVECDNIDMLASNILNLINDDALLNKMSTETRKRALEFKPDIILRQWEEYINSMIE